MKTTPQQCSFGVTVSLDCRQAYQRMIGEVRDERRSGKKSMERERERNVV